MGESFDISAQAIYIAFLSLFIAFPIYIATQGGVFRSNETKLPLAKRVVLYFELYCISVSVCAVYATLINLGVLDNDIRLMERRVPMHFLWGFFLVPALSLVIGKLWYSYRYVKTQPARNEREEQRNDDI